MNAASNDLLVKGGTLFDVGRAVETGDILVRDGRIVEIAPAIEARDATVFDARGKIVMPGFVNAHTHSNQALEKGLCDKYPLDAWMVIASYGGQNAELSPRELYVSAMIGAIEMIRTGSTAVVDMPRIPLGEFAKATDAIMQAYVDVGIRAGVAASFTDLNFAASLPLELVPGLIDELKPAPMAKIPDILGHLEGFIARWKDRHPLVQPMVGPSSLPRCSTEMFEAAVHLARDRGVGLQTHLLSAKGQVMVGRKRYGGSTVAFLKRIGALNKTSSYAHSIWLDDEEVGLIANSPAVVVHNPVSNMKLGSGRAPVPQLKKAGAHIALGADGGSSADAQNMFENLKGAAISHRNSLEQEDWILAEDALSMCWRGGARALNQPVGRLAEGCHADLTLLNTDTLLVAPWEQLAGQLVHSEMGASVESVIVGGEVVLDHGRFVSIDEKALRTEAQEIISRVYAGLPERMARFESVRPLFRELEAKVYRTALGFTRYCQ